MEKKLRVLDKIDKPSDLRLIRKDLLLQLVQEIRDEIIDTVSKTGGHLASSLGTVELITALHYVFDVPNDKIIFDVGHQAYAHKLLTGRREKFHTLRQLNGISGFPARYESEYDIFGVGHSSTAISAALGFATSRDLNNEKYQVIAVIGDGSMTGGLTFEGLNNAGHLNKDMLVVLNDNEMFISSRVGAIAKLLTRILTLGLLKRIEKRIETFFRRIKFVGMYMLRIAKRFKILLFPGMLFEEMGFAYLGPIDGHDLFGLIEIFNKVKELKGPVLLHVITKKGKGYNHAEKDPVKFHGAARFELETGNMDSSSAMTYTKVFSQAIIELAEKNNKIVGITAAMCEGTGLEEFAKLHPDKFFDVGIAEQHAITFAAGMAANGHKPVCAIYSTFLQRAIDQIIHDVAIQQLPVIFSIDRSGIVGEDGVTHQGLFDISFLRYIPNMIIMAPKDENELRHMVHSGFMYNKPVSIRYPRGKGTGVNIDTEFKNIPLGKAEVIKEGNDIFIIAIGNTVYPSVKAAETLFLQKGISCGVVNARFVKPLDTLLIKQISERVKYIITVEENVLAGGFGSAVREILENEVKILSIGLPDKFIEHGNSELLRKMYGLDTEGIVKQISDFYYK